MRMIIEARIEDNAGDSEPIRLAEFERADGDLKQLGLSLAEGRSLTYEAQRVLVNAQAQAFVVASRTCAQCGATLSIKATHTIRYRTVFGKVTIDSPQLRVCKCKIVALAVDSAWLRHRPSRQEQDEDKLSQYFPSKRPPPTGRHVNIIAGRAVRDDGCCKVYGYVHREVTSAATKLDHFLSEQGAAPDQKITIVSDGAGEFEKAVDGSRRPLTRILDWFHIAME